jgi:probable rRNA maturation factor
MKIYFEIPLFYKHFVSKNKCISAVLASFNDQKDTSAELGIVFTNNRRIRMLNKQFRNIDAPTDVLSFCMEENTGDNQIYLGDIVISIPQAVKQARVHRHSITDEITLLIIHGCLHLHGYDHETLKMKTDMWKVQNNILIKLNIDSTKLEI